MIRSKRQIDWCQRYSPRGCAGGAHLSSGDTINRISLDFLFYYSHRYIVDNRPLLVTVPFGIVSSSVAPAWRFHLRGTVPSWKVGPG